MLEVIGPAPGEAGCWEPDGSVEGDAGIALVAGRDVEVPESESGEPVERSDDRPGASLIVVALVRVTGVAYDRVMARGGE